MLNDIDTAAGVLRVLGDSARLRLLALCARGEHAVGDLVLATNLSQPRVSQHLKALLDQGLLERFRDGQYVYYRLPDDARGDLVRGLLRDWLPQAPAMANDLKRLRIGHGDLVAGTAADRVLNRAVLDCLLTRPVGRLLDIGSGAARMLSLLSEGASAAVGVDVDPDARRAARRRLAVAGLANCTIRAAGIEALPFADGSFETVIVDDVLRATTSLTAALAETVRVLAPDGLVLIIEQDASAAARRTRDIGRIAHNSGLTLSPARVVNGPEQSWWLATGRHLASSRLAS